MRKIAVSEQKEAGDRETARSNLCRQADAVEERNGERSPSLEYSWLSIWGTLRACLLILVYPE